MQKEYDRNMVVDEKISETDVVFRDIRIQPFTIYGLYNPTTEDKYKRLPDDVAKSTSEGVAALYLHTAGGRVRFATDSPYVAIKATYEVVTRSPKMSLINSDGFDLYEDLENSVSIYRGTFIPPVTMVSGYESLVKIKGEQKLRYFTLNLPSYSHPASIEIGIKDGSVLSEGLKYRNEKPIVFYGSSITQGACASRPGNIYQNVISQRLNLDYINLGFSGNARGEDTIVEYMAGLNFSVFVCDYDHNARTVEHLMKTHRRVYEIIRAKRPDEPYVMMSRPDFVRNIPDAIECRNVILDTYNYAIANGDKNVYFIDGELFFKGKYESSCTVDRTHPTDLGFALMADRIEECLKPIIEKQNI